jgi:hypothetical protein
LILRVFRHFIRGVFASEQAFIVCLARFSVFTAAMRGLSGIHLPPA